MSFQEKRSLVNLLSVLLIASGYAYYLLYLHGGEQLYQSTDLTFWAKIILWLIPIQIGANVVSHIIFSIINNIATREEDPDMEDERDKMVELRATRNSYYVFLIGFILCMIPLVMGQPIFVLFNLFVCLLFLAQITWTGSAFFYYRRGF